MSIKRYGVEVKHEGLHAMVPDYTDKNGEWVLHEDHAVEVARLNEQVQALAAENLTSRNAVQAFCDVVQSNTEAISEEVGADGVRIILAAMSATGNMPATDAILNEVRAQAVDAYCDEMDRQGVVTPRDFAARIRAGEVQNG